MPPYRFSKTVFSKINDDVVKLVREARLKAGLTQVQAARRLGCRQTFLSKIECGERRVDVAEFLILMQAYGTDPVRAFKQLSKA